ncbi:8f9b1653-5774-46e2-a1ca-66041cd2c67b [Sclerotinia trifoliorum]|uniref:8f9b1653-5774-46e2-a1ca-66041cd2c67b n=1 Tax=Sclerotinia trifoliorum TaxID=28548 RepID=A0A8H2VNW3_9HELO|nr:8f9b1653-5774-46e2-a1ca-66041cd2c67b [Sclerotinia trifoliorum]
MSFESLSERLTALQESNRQARELIRHLETIEFQPGSITLDGDDDNILLELSAEIAQVLKDQSEDFARLQEEVLSIPLGRPNSELQRQREVLDEAVEMHIEDLKSHHRAFLKAEIKAKKTLEAAKVLERQHMLQASLSPSSGRSTPNSIERPAARPKSELSKEDKTVNAASDVTLALRRTHEMMAGELEKSQFANDTLRQSTEALAQLNETYSTLDSLLSSSRNLLGTLLRSQKSDTWYLETAFYVLLCTIAWLVFRRLLYGPLWWLVYAPLKLTFYTLFGIFGIMGSKSGSAVESRISIVSEPATYATVSATSESVALGNKDIPVIDVGGGNRQSIEPEASTMVEEVEHIIDESQHYRAPDKEEIIVESVLDEPAQDAQVVLEEEVARSEQSDPGNPKKRMWEEPVEAAKEAERVRDEL